MVRAGDSGATSPEIADSWSSERDWRLVWGDKCLGSEWLCFWSGEGVSKGE